jgi:hypothetical protein
MKKVRARWLTNSSLVAKKINYYEVSLKERDCLQDLGVDSMVFRELM